MNIRAIAVGSVLVALGAVALAAPAAAEVIALRAELTAGAEVPANPSTARGTAQMSLDTASRNFAWTIHYTGLTAPLSAAHFHGPAATTANAGILVPMNVTADTRSPLTGFATLTPAQVEEVLSGRWYINLHTRTYPGGEIRGQVMR